MKFRSLVVAGVAVSALAAAPASQAALTGDQLVSGVGGTSVSINASTPVIFGTLFTPNDGDFTGTGSVSALSTSPTWTLSVKDGDASPTGHMKALSGVNLTGLGSLGLTGTSTCDKSESQLRDAPTITATGLPGTGVTTTPVVLSDTNQALAHGSAAILPLTAAVTTFTQHVYADESVQTGCLYRVTATYTVAAS